MSLVLTNIIIHKGIRSILDMVITDYRNKLASNNENKSILYLLFKNNEFKHFDFYKEAVALFNRNPDHIRYLDVRLAFDMERVNIPTVHVSLSRDNEFSKGIGNNFNVEGGWDFPDGTHVDSSTRIYNSSYTIVITSDNSFECVMIYELLRAMLVLMSPCLDDAGIQDLSVSGSDLSLNGQLIPPGTFVRTLDLQCKYTVKTPHLTIISSQAFDIIRDWRVNTTISTDEKDYKLA